MTTLRRWIRDADPMTGVGPSARLALLVMAALFAVLIAVTAVLS